MGIVVAVVIVYLAGAIVMTMLIAPFRIVQFRIGHPPDVPKEQHNRIETVALIATTAIWPILAAVIVLGWFLPATKKDDDA